MSMAHVHAWFAPDLHVPSFGVPATDTADIRGEPVHAPIVSGNPRVCTRVCEYLSNIRRRITGQVRIGSRQALDETKTYRLNRAVAGLFTNV